MTKLIRQYKNAANLAFMQVHADMLKIWRNAPIEFCYLSDRQGYALDALSSTLRKLP